MHLNPLNTIMKQFLSFGLMALSIAYVYGSDATPPHKTSTSQEAQKDSSHKAEKEGGFELVSYSATYAIELDREHYFDFGIQDVKGTLEVTTVEKDNLWHVVQKSTIFVYFKDKEKTARYDNISQTTESKDGLTYEFKTQSKTNEANEDEETQGVIQYPTHNTEYNDTNPPHDKRYVQYTQPEYVRVPLTKDVWLPRQYLQKVIQSAMKGKMQLKHQRIFDANNAAKEVVEIDSDMQPQPNFSINTTTPDVSDKATDTASHLSEADAFAKKLQRSTVWLLKQKIYEGTERTAIEPDYLLSMHINDIGVVLGMKDKYLDPEFSVKITLKECHSLNPQNIALAELKPLSQ